MPNNEKRRQKSLQKHAAKRKAKKHAVARAGGSLTPERAELRLAAGWPLFDCLVSTDWDEEGKLAQVIVARRGPLGEIAGASFLMDLGCLGAKDAFALLFTSERDYRQRLREPAEARMGMKKADLNLAARIVRDGIAYARGLGFSPHRDYYEAAPLLDGADPDAEKKQVPVGGKDGKPLFVAGPYDDVPRILAKLERAVGPDGFHFTAPLDAFGGALPPGARTLLGPGGETIALEDIVPLDAPGEPLDVEFTPLPEPEDE